MGDHCDQCIRGYYGAPSRGPCRPCACPHPTNSFSDTCVPDALDYICINCQSGYVGRHCEKCDVGFYGDLSREGGKCEPCNCNPYGSSGRDCDQRTGQCHCREGVKGRDCTLCSHGFILTEYGCKSCEDECTGVLLKELFEMKLVLDGTNLTDLPLLPWGYLDTLSNEILRLTPLVEEYQKNVSLGKELVDKFTFYLDLETQADMLLVKAKEYITKGKGVAGDAKDTLDEARKLLDELNKMWQKIKDIVAELNSQGLDPTGPDVSVKRMLQEAERLLREIKSRDFGPDKENAERELRKAQSLLANIKKLTLDRAHVDDLLQRIDKLDKLVGDMIRKIEEKVRKPVERALELLQVMKVRGKEVEANVKEINSVVEASNKTLIEADELLTLANGAMIDAAIKFDFLPRLLRELQNATDKLDEHREKLARLNPLYREKYVIPAQRHADALEKQSEHLANLFLATKELSDIPLQAAKAYQNIVDAINAAESAAEEAETAAENAYRQAYPDIGDALTERAARARAKSVQLRMEAQKLNDEKVPELEEKMRARKRDLDALSEDLAFGKRSNDVINRELDALPRGIKGTLEDATRRGRQAEARAKGADQRADELLRRLDNDLIPKYESIRAGSVGGLENLTRIIKQAKEDIREASARADSADNYVRRINKQHKQTQLDLKSLRDRILLARQKASTIQIGLTSDRQGRCVRSYKPVVEPSSTNSIVLNFATSSAAKDSLLFFIGSSTEEDFMAIEMVNRKIRFLWNVGGGTHVISHSKTIETNTEQLLKNDRWFKIEANRIGNIGTLSVKRTPDGQKPDPLEVTGAAPSGFGKMDLNASSNFFIGGFPDDFLPPSELRTSSFSGCLYEALFDGKRVGLWNFLTSDGCDACKEGATEDIDVNAYELQGGKSYAILPQISFYKKDGFYIALSFRTLNEDALLFFSGNFNMKQFISMELKGGKVVHQIRFDSRTLIRMETQKKYNNGKWIRIEAAREEFAAQFKVEDEFLEKSVVSGTNSGLDLDDSPLYYGGVPPNFTKESWPGISFTHFFGCLKDLQQDTTPLDLFKGSFFGMSPGCSNKPLQLATFKGQGHLELNGQPLPADGSFSFSFFTTQSSGLLLVSTFQGQQQATKQEQQQDRYSVALKEGRLVAMFYGGGGEILMTSNRTVRRGVFHTVNVLRKNRRFLLQLDDETVADGRLLKAPKEISSPAKGGLFLGGVKRGISLDNVVASQQPFAGIIQDVVFNNKILGLDEAVSYAGVAFGQPDIEAVSEEFLPQTMPSSPGHGCSSTVPFDHRAVSLQRDQPVHFALGKKDFFHNFNASVEYRTFYPEGNILSLSNEPRKLHLSVYLEKDYIKLYFSHKREKRTEKSLTTFSIGKWHRVEVLKHGKHLAMFVDKEKTIVFNLPKRLPFKMLSVGGVPVTSSLRELQGSFKGCMRNLEMNGKPVDIPSETACFRDVEFAPYFTGTDYITQEKGFHLGEKVKLSFQFRTLNYNGVVFSIFSKSTGFWFELSLEDAMVKASLSGGETLLTLDEKLKTDSSCDYEWHSIRMEFEGNHFALFVDERKPAERKIEKIPSDFLYADVYVGGKPDGEGNYFTGCIRSVTLNGESLQIKNPSDRDIIQYMCPKL